MESGRADDTLMLACNSATDLASRCMSGRSSAASSVLTIQWRSKPVWCSRWRPTAPATDGFSAARIEEVVAVTDKGCTVITLFPAEELPIANRY